MLCEPSSYSPSKNYIHYYGCKIGVTVHNGQHMHLGFENYASVRFKSSKIYRIVHFIVFLLSEIYLISLCFTYLKKV